MKARYPRDRYPPWLLDAVAKQSERSKDRHHGSNRQEGDEGAAVTLNIYLANPSSATARLHCQGGGALFDEEPCGNTDPEPNNACA